MHLVDGHGLLIGLLLLPLLDPALIGPGKACDIRHLRRRSRPHLRRGSVWIGFIEKPVIPCLDKVLVQTARLYTRHEQFPDSQRLQPLHGVAGLIPAVKFSDHMDCDRMGRPYCEVNALFSLEYGGMGSQLPKDIIVISLSNQILIKIDKALEISLELLT